MERRAAKTWVFSVAVALTGLATAAYAASFEPTSGRPFEVPWFVLAAGFVAAERFVVHLEVREQAHTLAFSEVPLTIGLIFADPRELVIARVVAAMLTIAMVRRLPLVKLVFNTGQFAVDVGVAVIVFHTVLNGGEAVEPIGWLAAVSAIAAGHLCTAALVASVMRLAGAPLTVRSVLTVVSVSLSAAIAGCAVALSASGALWVDGRTWVLLLVIGGALGYFFISFLRIRDRHQGLATLHGFTTALAAHHSIDQLGEVIARGIADLLKAKRVAVLVPVRDALLRILLDGEHVDVAAELTLDELSWVEAVGVSAAPGHKPRGQWLAGIELTSGNAISTRLPMPDRPGLVIVDGRLSNVRAFDDEDVQLLETAVGHAAAALSNAQLVDELREEAAFRSHQALHDDLTDLPNSRGLAETLQRPLSAATRLAVLTIRIDSLREVNETLGRAMGDEMLQHVSSRLLPLTEDGWCAKTASDEFTVVVRGGNDEAEAMAGKIVEAFEQPVLCDDVALAITAGIGVVLAPDHGRETEILLRRASLAASRSRVEGTRVTVWAADRDPYDPQRLAIAADLRDAIPAGELQVHFQPQVDIDSGLVISAEALVRWRHPRLGELRPDQFIAAAEYTGAIDALTEHVLSVAARTCAGWRNQGWDLDVSVNLSARNLANPSFADDVRRILDETGLDAGALTLELTESSIMTEAEAAMGTLEAIHGLGVAISIDDFGTGYSSLAHLRKLPVSEIKIDKSFVFDLTTNHNDEAIVRSMVDLGHHLGLTVVVEGVETVEVRRRLAELGADRIQGYLLSRPMPVHSFEQWIADRPVRMVDLSTGEAEAGAASPLDDFER